MKTIKSVFAYIVGFLIGVVVFADFLFWARDVSRLWR